MKITGLAEQYDTGSAVTWDQSAAHVVLSVEAVSGSNEGVALLTPAQARRLADGLKESADAADLYAEGDLL